jgi:hypothetical protein
VELAYSSSWTPSGGTGDRYLATGVHRKCLPNGISAGFHQSSLATVTVAARRGPQTGQAGIQLSGEGQDSCRWGTEILGADATLPYGFTAHVSAGSWSVMEDAQDVTADRPRTYSAGSHHTLRLNHAVWGPNGDLPYTWGSGHRIYLNTTQMFADPTFDAAGGAFDRTSYKLTKAGKTIVSRTLNSGDETINPVLKKAGWYTLTASALRHTANQKLASDGLSTKSALKLHFYADPTRTDQVRAYLTRFSPAGLNTRNQAQPGSRTTVTLGMRRDKPYDSEVHQLSDSVKRVRAWVSTDRGKTWHALQVRHSGSVWSTVVTNPASGTVSLRSEVTDSHKGTATTTVIRAYGVS